MSKRIRGNFMTIIKALSKEINERIARQCILALLDDDGSSMRAWLEEEFGDYPDYKLRPDRWVCRFIREATNGHAKLTFDPDMNQAQIMVGKGGARRANRIPGYHRSTGRPAQNGEPQARRRQRSLNDCDDPKAGWPPTPRKLMSADGNSPEPLRIPHNLCHAALLTSIKTVRL